MDDELVHIGTYILKPLEKEMRVKSANFGISKSEFIRLAVKHLLNLSEDDLRSVYENDKENQNDTSTGSRKKTQ